MEIKLLSGALGAEIKGINLKDTSAAVYYTHLPLPTPTYKYKTDVAVT